MSETITLESMDAHVTLLSKLRKHKEEVKVMLDNANEEIKELEYNIFQTLEGLNLSSFQGQAGTVTRISKHSYRVPKSEEQKDKFFKYLEDRGELMNYLTININSLNSYLKGELEARELDNNLDDSFPGLDEPYIRETLRFKITK